MKQLTLLLLMLWASLAQSIEFVTYYGYDQVENPVVAVDRYQGVMATRDTVAYGSRRLHTGNQEAFGHLGFTGQIDRSNNQIVYFNSRYYLPELRRFASPDPVTVVEGDYKHIDRYSYGYGNPVNANDPSGNAAETPWDIANAVVGWGTFGFDVAEGNWWGAAESGAGALYDTAAIFVPFLPGGASTALKGKRAAALVVDTASDASKSGGDVIHLPHTDKFGNVISRNPKSIQDQMTLEAAQRGEGIVKIPSLNDPKFKGMQKMELETISAGGKKSNVHYVRDPATGQTMDFKFKKHSADYIHIYEKN